MRTTSPLTLYIVSLATIIAPRSTATLQSSDITSKNVIDFLTKGHMLLRDVLPELRDETFREEHDCAKIESSRAYERFFIDTMGCDDGYSENDDNKSGGIFIERVDSGDGVQAMKECVERNKPEGIEEDEWEEAIVDKKPFYQLVNMHQYSRMIYDIATGPRFASMASDLLRVDRVRLYQTRTFRKVPSEDDTMRNLFNHPTYMHADLSMVPLDTNEYLTFWCPTRNLTDEDSVLTYATGSHRDIAQTLWHDNQEEEEEDDDYEDDEDDEENNEDKNEEENEVNYSKLD